MSSDLSKKDIELAQKMHVSQSYRGPDESGEYLDSNCFLGSNRFSITGIRNGRMPISNEDGTIFAIVNGEIYNYKKLRQELESKGHTFSKDSDSEVIVHAYEEFGLGCFKKLIGMFAIAIYDKRTSKLILARDRYGEKPLFYARRGGKFFFASESNMLLDVTKREIDKQALVEYLCLKFCKDHIVKGIKRVASGSYVVVSKRVTSHRYWRPEYFVNSSIGFEEAKEQYTNILRGIIDDMLPEEVKFGAFISGGLDSAAVSKLLFQRIQTGGFSNKLNKKLNLVTSGMVDINSDFKTAEGDYSPVESSGNELAYARRVAKGDDPVSEYNEREFTAADYLNYFREMVIHLPGGPVVSTSFPLYFFTSQEAKSQNIRVCYTGEGADDLMGGYTTADPYEGYTRGHEIEGFIALTKGFSKEEAEELTGIKPDFGYLQRFIDENFVGSGSEKDVLFNRIRLLMWLVIDKHMLEKADGMSMSMPVELRMPYLDVRSAEFVNSLPSNYFVGNGIKKRLLRSLAIDTDVAKEICERPKQRTALPYAALYYNSAYSNRFIGLLKDDNALIRKYVNSQALDRMITQSKDRPQKLHALLILEVWLREFIGSE